MNRASTIKTSEHPPIATNGAGSASRSAVRSLDPPGRHSRELCLSPAQEREWFREQTGVGAASLHHAVVLRLTGQLNLAVIEKCLNEIVRRHEVLRTAFLPSEGRPAPSLS